MLSNLGSDFQTEILPTTIYVFDWFLIVQIIDKSIPAYYFFQKCQFPPIRNISCDTDSGFLLLGMIAAVPLYTYLKVIVKNFSQRIK
jgi:hypothetical protein